MDLERLKHFLQDASIPIADKFGLAKLPENAHFIVASALFFWAVHLIFAPIVSRVLAPVSYGKLRSRNARNNWYVSKRPSNSAKQAHTTCRNIRVVSLVHSLIIIPFAFRNLYSPELDADRAFGWDKQYGYTASIACGYFIWDTFESSIHFTDVGFVIHGASSPCVHSKHH